MRRWHSWSCRFDPNKPKEAREDVIWLKKQGFRGRVWGPLPQHKTSGHTHIVVLCSNEQLEELVNLFEIEKEKKE